MSPPKVKPGISDVPLLVLPSPDPAPWEPDRIVLPVPDPAPWEPASPDLPLRRRDGWGGPRVTTCAICGRPFRPIRRAARTCSAACRQKAVRRRKAARAAGQQR